MPTQKPSFLVIGDGPETPPQRFDTREAALAETVRLKLDTDSVFEDHLFVETEEEKNSIDIVYLLTCEMCNGEYGTVVHRTIHKSLSGAMAMQEKMLNPEDLRGQDAINQWIEEQHEPGTLKFRTGNWGFIVWEIRPIKLIA